MYFYLLLLLFNYESAKTMYSSYKIRTVYQSLFLSLIKFHFPMQIFCIIPTNFLINADLIRLAIATTEVAKKKLFDQIH